MRPDKGKTSELLCAMHSLCAGEPAIDAIAAAASFLVNALAYASESLPEALENTDRIMSEVKDELRRRLAN